MSVLDDGRPLVVSTERERIGQGPWARLFATAAVVDESSSSAERGRGLARAGKVHTVAVTEGLLTGRVEEEGGEQTVEIAAEPVPPRIWAAAYRSARGNPQVEAAVAGRAQSVQLEHVMTVDWEEPLVPATRALRRTCSCGRPGTCEHVAALAYVIADRIDREPALLLRWRGCTEPAVERAEAPALEPEPIVAADEIWEAGALPTLGPPRPLPTAAVLKRLGPSGIQVGAHDLADVLERAYASFAASRP
ncbi:MAG TPA: SWIM zinc finger family protein [Gaiellaceae bacterium]|nr:SWIM zinc finger family protein [Gaiellaceae bacterium]